MGPALRMTFAYIYIAMEYLFVMKQSLMSEFPYF